MKKPFFIFVILSTAATLMSTSIAFGNALAPAYQDTQSHWAQNEIAKWSTQGILQGYNGQFLPNDIIRKGEMAILLDRIMQYPQPKDNSILDNSIYAVPMQKAMDAGILSKQTTPADAFVPLQRQEAVTMLAKAFHLSKSSRTTFTDDAEILEDAVASVAAMQDAGYIAGYEGKFEPQRPVTRAETVKMLDNILSNVYNQNGEFSENAQKNVIISSPDVHLRDAVIAGNLIVTQGVGDGTVTLENVTVKGTVEIYGGGLHSVNMKDCTLSFVTVENQMGPVRLNAQGSTTIGNVNISTPATLEGVYSTVSITNNEPVTLKCDIKTLTIAQPASVLIEKGRLDQVILVPIAQGSTVKVAKEASITLFDIHASSDIEIDGKVQQVVLNAAAENTTLTGKGSIEKTDVFSNNAKINLQSTTVSIAEDVVGTAYLGSSTSQTTTSTSTSGGGGGGGSNNDEAPSYRILSVQSVRNGLVRVTLNRVTSQALEPSAFSIICTGGGSDMTIRSVSTKDQKTYDIATAFYKDDTYNLEITLPNGKRLEKDFISKYDCPALSAMQTKRTGLSDATVSFVSDTPGEFYYALSKNTLAKNILTRSFLPDDTEPTLEKLLQAGTAVEMKLHLNEISIENLEEDTAYTLYYAARDADNRLTPIRSISVAGAPSTIPPGNIQIESAKADCHIGDLFDENYWFEIVLSEPTKKPLALENFEITCPAMSDISLGRVATTDNQTYIVYMQRGVVPVDNNTFTAHITFEDATTAEKSFYVDLSAPLISSMTITSYTDNTTIVSFFANEPGKMYYKIKDDVPQDTRPKDPTDIYASGTVIPIVYGENTLKLDSVSAGKWFCSATEDQYLNHTLYFDYKKIPAPVEPEPQPPEEQIKITDVKASKNFSTIRLTVTLSEEVKLNDIDNMRTNVTNIGGTGLFELEYNKTDKHVVFVTIKNFSTIPDGSHRLDLFVKDKLISFTFTTGSEEPSTSSAEILLDLH